MRRFKSSEIDEIVKILKNDGVISVPTDTVYGLCASINSNKARKKLMLIKKRPENKLLPVMCANIEQIKSIAFINNNAEKIIDEFMPGPITIILNIRDDIPEYINNGEKTIAVRMATSRELEEIIIKLSCPVFMSSANKSGEKACSSLDEIEKECIGIDGILEGDIIFNIGSTIVDCTTDEIKILREGPISEDMINKVIKY